MILINAKEFAGTVYDNHLETISYNKQDNPQGKQDIIGIYYSQNNSTNKREIKTIFRQGFPTENRRRKAIVKSFCAQLFRF